MFIRELNFIRYTGLNCELNKFLPDLGQYLPHANQKGGVSMYYSSRLSENLRALRMARGMSQRALADRLSLTSSVISAYENDIRMPSYDVLFRLASIFNCSCDELLGYKSDKNLPEMQIIDVSDLNSQQLRAIDSVLEAFRSGKK